LVFELSMPNDPLLKQLQFYAPGRRNMKHASIPVNIRHGFLFKGRVAITRPKKSHVKTWL
jgi:hypothetical protein